MSHHDLREEPYAMPSLCDCVSCGFPGSVAVDDAGDDEDVAWWRESDDEAAVCNDAGCDWCAETRKRTAAALLEQGEEGA